MNLALDAVRFAEPTAFQDSPKASKTAKRAMLRHLADLSSWTCELSAYFNGRKATKCSHESCKVLCFQAEPVMADELSMNLSTVQRVRRALLEEGWITTAQNNAGGRGAITFYELNLEKLLLSQRNTRRDVSRRLPAVYRAAISSQPETDGTLPLFEDSEQPSLATRKGGTMHTFHETSVNEKGWHGAEERVAPCTEKGGMRALLNKKNPIEPSTEPNTISLTLASPPNEYVEQVYQAYPRKVAKADALKAIRAAFRHLASGKDVPSMAAPEALAFLLSIVGLYAQSPAGMAGAFTPHPATWFNAQRYLDDTQEWSHGTNNAKHDPNHARARVDSIVEALRRADEADATRTNTSTSREPLPGTQGSYGFRGTGPVLEGARGVSR